MTFTVTEGQSGKIWENQGVGDNGKFLREFKQRLVDCWKQEWHAGLDGKDRYLLYRSCKAYPELSLYIVEITHVQMRAVYTRFILGVSPLKTHKLRFSKETNVDKSCPFCDGEEESELHFTFICPMYMPLRNELIPAKYFRQPNLFRLTLLLATKNKTVYLNTIKYVYETFKTREDKLG